MGYSEAEGSWCVYSARGATWYLVGRKIWDSYLRPLDSIPQLGQRYPEPVAMWCASLEETFLWKSLELFFFLKILFVYFGE